MIKALIIAFKEAELTSLSLKCEDFELELGKNATLQGATLVEGNTVPYMMSPLSGDSLNTETLNNKKCIKSPIVGTFYGASSPQAEPFVTVGTKVKKGDIVCVVEAMKLMNEVEAEEDGEIIEILVGNEEMVEYGQPLFVMR